MGRKSVTCDDIIRMRELYAELGTYAAVSRKVGFSASTVRKYILEDIEIEKEIRASAQETFKGEIKDIQDIVCPCDLSNIEIDENINGFMISESFSHKKYYFITVSFDFGLAFCSFVPNGGYSRLIADLLFNLKYEDYLLMIKDNYNGVIVGEEGKQYLLFKDKKDAEQVIKELNKRLHYIIKKGK